MEHESVVGTPRPATRETTNVRVQCVFSTSPNLVAPGAILVETRGVLVSGADLAAKLRVGLVSHGPQEVRQGCERRHSQALGALHRLCEGGAAAAAAARRKGGTGATDGLRNGNGNGRWSLCSCR